MKTATLNFLFFTCQFETMYRHISFVTAAYEINKYEYESKKQ